MTTSQLLQLAQQLDSRDEPYAMVTVVRAAAPTSAYAGAQAIVCGDGSQHGWIGGGCAKRVVVNAALDAIRLGAPRLVRISNDSEMASADIESHRMPCASNGEIELFVHPFGTAPRLLILGATPAAAAAHALAQDRGFRVTTFQALAPSAENLTSAERTRQNSAQLLRCFLGARPAET